jgi:hypothetical protein
MQAESVAARLSGTCDYPRPFAPLSAIAKCRLIEAPEEVVVYEDLAMAEAGRTIRSPLASIVLKRIATRSAPER